MSNERNTVIYTGITNDIYGRVLEHKTKTHKNSFTAKYNVNKLIYYEEYNEIGEAIFREKQIKNYSRQKKVELVEKNNPNWLDLADDWYEDSWLE